MSSQLCTHCFGVLSELLADEEDKTIHHEGELVAYPLTCYFCAKLCFREAHGIEPPFRLADLRYDIETHFPSKLQSIFVQFTPAALVALGGSGTSTRNFCITSLSDGNPSIPWEEQSNTFSKSSFDFLRRKLEECLTSHPLCGRQAKSHGGFVPARLLELQLDDSSRIVLVDTEKGSSATYCTLSHCWGKTLLPRLIRSSERSLRAGISIRDLPSTFQHAIEVCHQLQIPYIWIDSMCIFQDTDESSDWHAQSAVMGQIYSSAIVNIAASSAHDSRSGLKYQWNSMAMAPFFITPSKKARPQESPERLTSNTKFGIYPNDDFYVAVVTSPLNGRAWVLQERFLSTRVVHFTSSGVYWECMTGTCSSTYPLCLPESDQFFGIDDLKLKQMMLNARNKTLGGEQSVWTDELYGAWADTLSYYSNCNISFVRDKLVALNGIAKRLAETVDDELICGLWKRYLIPQLLWYVNERRNNVLTEDEWIAPTWSWASRRFGEEIHHSTHILCGVSKEVASIKRFSMQKRSSGQIIKASLELQGRVVHAHLALTMDKRGLRMDRRFSLNLDSPKEWSHTQFCVMLDEEESHAAGERVLCIALYEDDCERGLSLGSALYPNGAIEHLGVLVLQQYSLQPRVYKRIGIMLLQGHRSGLYKSQESAQEQDIVLM